MAVENAILYCDGGARGNPGFAAAAAILIPVRASDPCREGSAEYSVQQRAWFLGRTTNNEAEYRALLGGLEMALDMGVRRIEVRTDSELVARQVNGEYAVKKSNLKPLHRRAMELLGDFDEWRVVSIPREENQEADALVNEVLDSVEN